VKRWPIRLAVLTAIGVGILLGLRLQPWSLLTIKNVGSTPLTVDNAFEGPDGASIKGVLNPGQRRFGLFRLRSEAGMGLDCRSPGPPPANFNPGYYMAYQPHILALDLKDCKIAAAHEVPDPLEILLGPRR